MIFLELRSLGSVGYPVVDDNAKRIKCASYWEDMEGFKDFFVERMIK